MDTRKRIVGFDRPFDHASLEEFIREMCARYDFIDISSLSQSILGKSIPTITIGRGKHSVLYVGAHHGAEWITSALLARFINELCEEYKNGAKMFGISLDLILEARRIIIIPMLNPDGVDYSIHGPKSDHVLYSRLFRMNGCSSDFSRWQANARGVDLNHNYDSGFKEYKNVERALGISGGARSKYSGEAPESEPETSALCNLIRFHLPKAVITLHSQGEEIYYTSGGLLAPASLKIGSILSRLTGYKLASPEGTAAYGGLTDWFIECFNKPSFTLECGRGENPLPLSDLSDIYFDLRQALFTFPTLI